MSTVRTVNTNPNGTPRWLLPIALALLILIIIAAAFFATHPHIFSAAATSTPTVTATPRSVTKVVTNTPTAGPKVVTATPSSAGPPTSTPKAGASANGGSGGTPTPAPQPSATPQPSPTPTPDYGVKLGAIPHPQSQLLTIQQGANRNESQYTLNLDPYRVVRSSLPSYGFKTVTIVSPPPAPHPTPTPFTGPNNQPTVQITVQYQGHTFIVTLQQPVQHGPKGIWVVTTIKVG
jgi:hypothetical protein